MSDPTEESITLEEAMRARAEARDEAVSAIDDIEAKTDKLKRGYRLLQGLFLLSALAGIVFRHDALLIWSGLSLLFTEMQVHYMEGTVRYFRTEVRQMEQHHGLMMGLHTVIGFVSDPTPPPKKKKGK